MNTFPREISRRTVLLGMGGALAAPMVIRSSSALAQSSSVTFCGYGGSYQDIIVEHALKPFTEETGIKVNVVPAPDMAKVKAQVMMGNVEWDVYDVTDSSAAFGSTQGFWERLDPSIFDVADMAVPPQTDAVPFFVNTAGIAWDPNRYGPGEHPANFAEFFDVKKFPGRRAMRAYEEGTFEGALLADGVAPKDIYPLDVDRALKVLDRIKPLVVTWATAPQQTITLMQTGEVDYGQATVNRVKATTLPGGGVPLAFSFEQNTFSNDMLTVIKGAPNKENAMKLLAYVLRPETQARVMEPLGFIPISKKATTMLSADAAKWLPDLGNSNSMFVDPNYWAENYEAVSRRFKEWIRT
ncbi:ABC transporter substrate-binding protein [Mesorhizobium sp. M1380]|uniref:ABC transporter substrate-binding protein n=1 Tax=Mesorhizobium sp. M1380 TaxID=2957093 RepID=UPI00333C1DE3